MASKKVAVFSTGIPDPSQGGSGIFNYYVVRELLARGYQVDGFFRANDSFLNNHTVNGYLVELSSQGLQYRIIDGHSQSNRGAFGFRLLMQSHQVDVCEKVVDKLIIDHAQYDAYIAHDLGWIIALAGKVKPLVGLVGDPLPGRLKHGNDVLLASPRSWLLRLKALSTESRATNIALAKRLNGNLTLGSFSPHHVQEYQSGGVECTHFRWFSPEVERPSRVIETKPKDCVRLLHVGTLASTASSKMLRYWMTELLPALASLPFNIEIRFVGRGGKSYDSRWSNIRLVFLGHEDALEAEFDNCDVFFSPMKYPVGTRTRILTAMAHGVPTIADWTASLGLPELINCKDIFYGSSPHEIKSIIKQLHESPELRNAVGKSAREKWEALFQPQKNVASILAAVDL